jgi:hypothetical protein
MLKLTLLAALHIQKLFNCANNVPMIIFLPIYKLLQCRIESLCIVDSVLFTIKFVPHITIL